MCLARVRFIDRGEHEGQDVLTEVARIERAGTGLRLTDLVGVTTHVEGEICSIDFLESVVRIEKRPRRRENEKTKGDNIQCHG